MLGDDAVTGQLYGELKGYVGAQSAEAIQSMMQSANKPDQGVLATVVGFVTLIVAVPSAAAGGGFPPREVHTAARGIGRVTNGMGRKSQRLKLPFASGCGVHFARVSAGRPTNPQGHPRTFPRAPVDPPRPAQQIRRGMGEGPTH